MDETEINEIIKKIQNGNIEAFETLFNLYNERAKRTAYLITGNIYTSEDVVQETFVQCYKNIRQLKNPSCFKVWFYKILVRLSYKEIKKYKKSIPVENIFERADSASINLSLNNYLSSHEQNILRNEINNLNNSLKTVVILHYFNDMTINEISKALNCFEGTVKSRLFNARKQLKSKLLRMEADNYDG